jgi:hypothetical protein
LQSNHSQVVAFKFLLHRHHCRPCQAILGGPLAKRPRRLRHHGRHRGCRLVERVGTNRARSLGSSQRAPLLREHRAGWREPHSRPSSLRVRRRSHRPYAKPPLRKQSQAASNNGVRHGFFWFRLARFVSSAAFVHVSRLSDYPHYVYVVARTGTGPMRSHRSGNSRKLISGILSDIAFFGLRARRPMERSSRGVAAE